MSETLLCILLVSSSAKGSNIVYHWPPAPQTIPRLARPLPTDDFPGSYADNPWRAANSPDNVSNRRPPGVSVFTNDDDEGEYYWQRPVARRGRSVSFTRAPPRSHPASRRASPSKSDSISITTATTTTVGGTGAADETTAGATGADTGDEYDALLGYPAEFLAQVLCPADAQCHQKFELVVDDLAFLGHPVCANSDGAWRFRRRPTSAARAADRGRGSKKGTHSPAGAEVERLLTPERAERGEARGGGDGDDDGDGGGEPARVSGMQTFHFVVVLDLPDPSSSASGNISRYFDVVYEQVAFSVTAVLYQEQVLHQYVETECDLLGAMKEDFANRGESYIDFMYEALKVSTIAPAMKTLYESIKGNAIARISLNDLPLELQLPPFLDSLLHADEDVSPEAYEDDNGEPSAWGPAMTFAWRLPTLTPWKALLRLDDDDSETYQLYMQLRAAQLNSDERDLAEQLVRFLDMASVTLSLADLASLLDWHIEAQVYPAVRWLVLHRRAKIVDVVHPGLKTVFTVPQNFPSPLAALSEEFAQRFADTDVPPLPKLLAMLSTATHKPSASHFYATVVGAKDRIPLYTDVVLWMLTRDLLIRLHLRIRVTATAALKHRVRRRWEEHVMRRRSRSRARSITRGSDRAHRDAGREGEEEGSGAGEDAAMGLGLGLETVSESSPVDYWVSFSPKTMRQQARGEHPRSSGTSGEKIGDGDHEDYGYDEKRRAESRDEGDEEWLSSSADEAKWNEYYRDGGDDGVASMISDPARATPLERRWLAGMSEGKDPMVVRRFERIHQYFDGKCSDDEILYRAEITRKQLREVLHHYEEYLQTFLHPS